MSVLRVMLPAPATQLDDRLDALGAVRLRLELPLGRLSWLDEEGAVVAHARCVPLYAWSSQRQQLHPARALPALGAQTPDEDRDEPTVRQDVDRDAAMDFAQRRARALRLTAAVPVATPSGRHLFVGIEPLCLGAPDDGARDEVDQAAQLVHWAAEVLALLVRSLADGELEAARSALLAFQDALTTAITAVYHLPVAEDLATLRSHVEAWSAQLNGDQLAVAIRVRREQLRWAPAAAD